MPRVGALINGSPQDAESLVMPFRVGLGDEGYIEGLNVAVEYRWAEGHNERLSTLAAELINLRVAVLATLYGASAALAAKALTNSIPIVFLTGGDASELGIVANRDRPEANLTGVSGFPGIAADRSVADAVSQWQILRAADKSSQCKRQSIGADHAGGSEIDQARTGRGYSEQRKRA